MKEEKEGWVSTYNAVENLTKRSERSSRKDTIPAIVTGKPVEFRFDSTGMDSRVETKSQGAGCFLTPRKSQESIISDSRKSSRNENKILSQESKESEDMILLMEDRAVGEENKNYVVLPEKKRKKIISHLIRILLY